MILNISCCVACAVTQFHYTLYQWTTDCKIYFYEWQNKIWNVFILLQFGSLDVRRKKFNKPESPPPLPQELWNDINNVVTFQIFGISSKNVPGAVFRSHYPYSQFLLSRMMKPPYKRTDLIPLVESWSIPSSALHISSLVHKIYLFESLFNCDVLTNSRAETMQIRGKEVWGSHKVGIILWAVYDTV
jgi:hypothetical protein